MLVDDIKALIIDVLDLEDIAPGDIDASGALFGDGLGLDSIDALALGIALQKRYEIKIDVEADDMRKHLFSVDPLHEFVDARRKAVWLAFLPPLRTYSHISNAPSPNPTNR